MSFIDVSREEMEERAQDALKILLGFAKVMAEDPESMMPRAECKVCGEERSQDLVAHGPFVARFMYYPCRHSELIKANVSYWFDEDDRKVEV